MEGGNQHQDAFLTPFVTQWDGKDSINFTISYVLYVHINMCIINMISLFYLYIITGIINTSWHQQPQFKQIIWTWLYIEQNVFAGVKGCLYLSGVSQWTLFNLHMLDRHLSTVAITVNRSVFHRKQMTVSITLQVCVMWDGPSELKQSWN